MLVFTLLLFLLSGVLYAYLDPGTGTALINIVISGFVAIGYGMKELIIRLIRKNKKELKEKMERKNQISISIFSEGKQYWNSYKAIIDELIKSKIVFNYYSIDIEDPALLIENEFINSRFLRYGISSRAKFMAIKGDILLTTTPNIGAEGYLPRPKNVKRMIHFFHSVSDISIYKKHSLDFYDEVYMAGGFQEKAIREIEKKRGIKTKKLTPLGLPYLDELLKGKVSSSNESPNKTILIGSSWGKKGLLNYYGTNFIKKLAKGDVNIIFRPHPQSLKSEKSLIKKYKRELKNIPNVCWDEAVDPNPSMSIADLLISDTSSLRYDYAFIYCKPVITLKIPLSAMPGYERDDISSILIDEASREIGYVLNSEELIDIEKYILKINNEFDVVRMKNLRDSIVSNYGCSASAIVQQLKFKENYE